MVRFARFLRRCAGISRGASAKSADDPAVGKVIGGVAGHGGPVYLHPARDVRPILTEAVNHDLVIHTRFREELHPAGAGFAVNIIVGDDGRQSVHGASGIDRQHRVEIAVEGIERDQDGRALIPLIGPPEGEAGARPSLSWRRDYCRS